MLNAVFIQHLKGTTPKVTIGKRNLRYLHQIRAEQKHDNENQTGPADILCLLSHRHFTHLKLSPNVLQLLCKTKS